MNAARRKILAKALAMVTEARDLIEEAKCGEEEAYDNMPESLQESERGETMQDYIAAMEDAIMSLEEAEDLENQIELN